MKGSASRTTRFIVVPLSFTVLLLSLSCVKRQRSGVSANPLVITQTPQKQLNVDPIVAPRININTASAVELEKLPGIGKALAARIVEHRAAFGPFRRPEHLIMVRGMSDKRFRALRELITVE